MRGVGSMVHMKKMTPKRRFEWRERNYVRNCVFIVRPGTFGPLDSGSKKGTFGGGRKGMFFMFLCSINCACGHDLSHQDNLIHESPLYTLG